MGPVDKGLIHRDGAPEGGTHGIPKGPVSRQPVVIHGGWQETGPLVESMTVAFFMIFRGPQWQVGGTNLDTK